MTKFGFSGLNNTFNSNNNNGFNTSNASSLDNLIVYGRVKSIILNDKHPRFKELGGWSALGAIEYELVSNSVSFDKASIAYPLNSNIKSHPLLGEIVFIKTFPSTEISKDGSSNNKTSQKSYYSNVALWNHPHHNASPTTPKSVPPSQDKSYSQTQLGSPKVVSNEPVAITLGSTFKERSDIHPLLPFEGDIIHEGRWGNSIRLGSTVISSASLSPNDWSTEGIGQDGDPIIVIRNGQGNTLTNPSTGEDITNQGWVPIIENINNDQSSIYLTSTQNVYLTVSSIKNYNSYPKGTAPISPDKFAGQQILLNSGRLVFNSKNDHILLSSAKSINLNSLISVNIDTSVLSVKADNIYLGENSNYDKNEPLMLGVQTVNLLKNLVHTLNTFMEITAQSTTNITINGNSATLPAINSAAKDVTDCLYELNKTLGSDPELKDCKLISKRNYTV